MCGLVGVAGKIGITDEKAFNDLLIMDSVRGFHSTGVFQAGGWGVNPPSYLFKKALTPWELIFTKEYSEMEKKSKNIVIGHNRWATRGKINDENAHPFEFETIVGAHNGTLWRQDLLPDNKDFEVDSENIFHSIEKIGIEETHKLLWGAYALTYYDKVNKKLHIVRNKERDLFICYANNGSTLFWSSEEGILRCCLDRRDVQYGEIVLIPEHTLFTFDIVFGFQLGNRIDKPEIKKLIPYKPPVGKSSGVKNPSRPPLLKNQESNSSSLQSSEVKRILESMDKKLIFDTVGYVPASKGCSEYIQCIVEGFEDFDFRWYTEKGDSVEQIMDSGPYKGQVRQIRSRNKTVYAKMDRRSIRTHTHAGEGEDIRGYNDRPLTLKLFKEVTKQGCAWCSDVPKVCDSDYLKWISPDSFVCEDCACLPDVSCYIQ